MNTRKANKEMDAKSVAAIETLLTKDTNELIEADVLFLRARASYLDADEMERVENSLAGKALAEKEAKLAKKEAKKN